MRSPALAACMLVLLACVRQDEPAPLERPDASIRVISLAPAITRIVLALGARDVLVGADEVSLRQPGLETLASIGGLFGPDLERSVELAPTLVLAVRSAAQRDYVDRLRAEGVRVEELDSHRFDEVLESFRAIGALVGRAEEAERLAERVRLEVEAVARAAERLPRRTVALVVEREPLYVAGGGSFTQALIEAAGGSNVFGDEPAPYLRVSLEAIAGRAPEVVIDATAPSIAGAAAEDAARAYWQRFAWRPRVEALVAEAATLPGPDLAEGARALLARIHPEAQIERDPANDR
jgi:ABC-type Fe3+-hydroxamate transport system substrate-binding protein